LSVKRGSKLQHMQRDRIIIYLRQSWCVCRQSPAMLLLSSCRRGGICVESKSGAAAGWMGPKQSHAAAIFILLGGNTSCVGQDGGACATSRPAHTNILYTNESELYMLSAGRRWAPLSPRSPRESSPFSQVQGRRVHVCAREWVNESGGYALSLYMWLLGEWVAACVIIDSSDWFICVAQTRCMRQHNDRPAISSAHINN